MLSRLTRLPRIALVSTYPPTQCGIATFTQSLAGAMFHMGDDVEIVAIDLAGQGDFGPDVVHRHRGAADLPVTVSVLDSYDVVIVQHEFGIHDGIDGVGVLDLIAETKTPVISVVHTVPRTPTGGQRHALQGVLDLSDAVVALSYSAERLLRKDYVVRPHSLHVIPHGARDTWRLRSNTPRPTRPRIMTWGLIGEGKGIEWGIEALALLGDLDPQPEYVIAGCTHPKVRAAIGETYRERLEALASERGVQARVRFVDHYLDEESLAELMCSSTAFLLPYDSRDQITSGVLVEAMVAGGPVIATRFPHAAELLSDGSGILVEHADPEDIARAIRLLVEDPQAADKMSDLAVAMSRPFLWSSVAERYLSLADDVWRQRSLSGRMEQILDRDVFSTLRVAQ